jgi:hypothetical protein
LDVHSEEDDGLFDGFYKSLVRWGIHRVGVVTVDLDTLSVYSDYGDAIILANVSSPLLEIPLSSDPPSDGSWLTKMSATFFVEPTNDTARMIEFTKDAWREGSVKVKVHIPQVSVQGGGVLGSSWRNRIHVVRTAMQNKIHVPIPHIPGLPDPDRNSHFPRVSDLVTLQGFRVFSSSSSSKHLSLNAKATVVNPAPDYFKLTTPHLPFFVSLPGLPSNLTQQPPPIPVAAVHTLPFQMTHPNITLSIEGHVLPLTQNPNAFPTLSAFISNYLSARESPILISSPYLPNFDLETVFPAPPTRPHILRDVTIHDMKVKPLGSKLFASGVIFARIVLPKGMDLGLQVNRVLPDVLVFDGEVPPETKLPHPMYPGTRNNDTGSTPPRPPLPDPLPSKAFGHIRPSDWIDALSVPEHLPHNGEEEENGAAFAVSARIVDVPLEVLPGRQKEFSNFVSKVIFGSDGALAGILGTTYVSVDVWGIPGKDMELGNLPFQGVVKVGKWGSSAD